MWIEIMPHSGDEGEKGSGRERNTRYGITIAPPPLLLLIHLFQPRSAFKTEAYYGSHLLSKRNNNGIHRRLIRNTTLLHRLMSILVARNVILELPRKNRVHALEGDLKNICWEGRTKQVVSKETEVLSHWERNK